MESCEKTSTLLFVDEENVNSDVLYPSSCEDDVLVLSEVLEERFSRKTFGFFLLVVVLVIYVSIYICISSLRTMCAWFGN